MNKSKNKGTKGETAVVKYLQEHGWKTAERRALKGNLDCGDISGVENLCLEVKNTKIKELGVWTEQLLVEIKNAKATTGAIIHNRVRKTDVGDWYATMPVHIYVQLLKDAGY